jgi:hypothetical protein
MVEWLMPTSRRVVSGLFLLVVVAALPVVHPYRAQQASRYALTAAVVERGTVLLDAYEGVLGIDRAVRDGHTYSDKAPGQPFYAVPFFAVGKAAGVEEATNLRIDKNLGVWWVTLWSATVFGALLAVMMYRRVRDVVGEWAVAAALGVLFGTMLLPFSALLFGHVMAAALLFGSYLAIESRRGSRPLLGGLLAGLAVLVEYTAVLGVLVLVGLVLWRHRRSLVRVVAGGVPAAAALGVYNAIAFGSPFTFSYQFSAFSQVTEDARPLFDMFSSPAFDNLAKLLFSGRGLLVATPLVLVAVVAAIRQSLQKRDVDSLVGLGMVGVFLLLPIFWGNPWGGDSPGPRYMTPALPFLAVPLAWAWSRWRLLTTAAVAISVLTMVAGTLTDPLLSRHELGGLNIWLPALITGQTTDTLWTMALGGWGWVLHLLTIGGVLYWLTRVARKPPPTPVEMLE